MIKEDNSTVLYLNNIDLKIGYKNIEIKEVSLQYLNVDRKDFMKSHVIIYRDINNNQVKVVKTRY